MKNRTCHSQGLLLFLWEITIACRLPGIRRLYFFVPAVSGPPRASAPTKDGGSGGRLVAAPTGALFMPIGGNQRAAGRVSSVGAVHERPVCPSLARVCGRFMKRPYSAICRFSVGATCVSRETWYTAVKAHGIQIHSLEIDLFKSLPFSTLYSAILKFLKHTQKEVSSGLGRNSTCSSIIVSLR